VALSALAGSLMELRVIHQGLAAHVAANERLLGARGAAEPAAPTDVELLPSPLVDKARAVSYALRARRPAREVCLVAQDAANYCAALMGAPGKPVDEPFWEEVSRLSAALTHPLHPSAASSAQQGGVMVLGDTGPLVEAVRGVAAAESLTDLASRSAETKTQK
jgi:hypothetical protein